MTREADLKQLEQEYKRTRDPKLRRHIAEAGKKIANESGAIRSMRDSLVKAHREGNEAEIKDIHDIVSKSEEYQNERNSL